MGAARRRRDCGLDAINYGGSHLPYEGTRRPLIEWRFTNECLRRKHAILGHPFTKSEDGYLPGYLAVRQLWLQMSSAGHRLLNESDLFLMALRSFFYDDYELIGLLLDDSPCGASNKRGHPGPYRGPS